MKRVIKKKVKKKYVIKKNITKKKNGKSQLEKKDRVPTGIKNFDYYTEGGFEKNSTNLIVGISGSGKSIFATRFIIEGVENGENCLYVSFEETKEEFFRNMKRFGWDLEKYENDGRFKFLEYEPEKVKNMILEGGGAIENLVLKNKISRMVIDSINSFELLFPSEIEKREASLNLFRMINNWNCTTILTYEGDPIKGDSIDQKALGFESESIILLYYLREKEERERYLEILKMRGTKHSRYIFKFNISSKGITMNKKPYKGTNIKKLY